MTFHLSDRYLFEGLLVRNGKVCTLNFSQFNLHETIVSPERPLLPRILRELFVLLGRLLLRRLALREETDVC